MKYCPECNVPVEDNCNHCEKCDYEDDDGTSFLTSLIIGGITDSAILGGLLGGDMLGGIIGDMMDGDLMD